MFLSKSQTQPSIIEQTPLQNNDDWNSIIFTKTAWLLLAVAINTFEQFIPRLPFLPWLKPGLANCITILWIVKFGWKDAFVYALLRVWISGFYFGFSLLTFGLGLSGGILSTLIMGLLWETLGKKQVLSTIGIGIIGALFHNLGQLGAVYVLVAQNVKLFYQLPIMVIASIIFGGTVGAIAPYIWTSIHSIETPANIITKTDRFAFHRKPIQLVFSLSLLAFCISLLFIQSWHILLIVALLISIAAIGATGKFTSLIFPLRFWLFFFFVAFMFCFFTFGTKINHLPWITIEGMQETSLQWLRLWTWLQATLLFKQFGFNDQLMILLIRLLPNQRSTIYAGLFAMEYFPQIAAFRSKQKINLLDRNLVSKMYAHIVTTLEK